MKSSFAVIHGRTAEYIIRHKDDLLSQSTWPEFNKDGWRFKLKNVVNKYLEYLESEFHPENLFSVENSRMFVVVTKHLEITDVRPRKINKKTLILRRNFFTGRCSKNQ